LKLKWIDGLQAGALTFRVQEDASVAPLQNRELTVRRSLLIWAAMTNRSQRVETWFGWAYYFSPLNLRVGLL
jgi:hypothetical protein